MILITYPCDSFLVPQNTSVDEILAKIDKRMCERSKIQKILTLRCKTGLGLISQNRLQHHIEWGCRSNSGRDDGRPTTTTCSRGHRSHQTLTGSWSRTMHDAKVRHMGHIKACLEDAKDCNTHAHGDRSPNNWNTKTDLRSQSHGAQELGICIIYHEVTRGWDEEPLL